MLLRDLPPVDKNLDKAGRAVVGGCVCVRVCACVCVCECLYERASARAVLDRRLMRKMVGAKKKIKLGTIAGWKRKRRTKEL